MNILAESITATFFGMIWQVVSTTWFIFFPFLFYYIFKILWMDFVQDNYWSKIEWTILEIIPPNDIEETPQAMEMVYAGLLGSMKGINTIEEFVNGETPMYFSLELVSKEGEVHFYVRTPKGFRDLIESHIHSQYPTAVVQTGPDYVDEIPKVIPNKDWGLWGTDFRLEKADPYPIKTYRWFEEDATGKVLDPLASLIESMGKIGPQQYFWFQMVITPKDAQEYDTGKALAEELAGREVKRKVGALESWFVNTMTSIHDTVANMFGLGAESPSESEPDVPLEFRMTPGEKEVLKLIEEGIGKSAFNVKMRVIYVGRKEAFNKAVVGSFMGGIKQFSDANLNGFALDNNSKTYALHLFVKPRMQYRQRKILRRYRARNRDGVTFHLNSEELATVFHLPTTYVITPSLRKVETKT
ncbi:MAG TPA: hypothetical protein ENJ49_01340, partial [Candidatus Moranbacteria bacterium]|nr:hypothetical protein [Candidatus Moranbacteria bacterium]